MQYDIHADEQFAEYNIQSARLDSKLNCV